MFLFLPCLLMTLLVMPPAELPGSWLDRFKLAEEALETERFDEAIEYLEGCLQLVPRNATTAYHLACAHAREGRVDEALSWLDKSVDWGWIDAAVMHWDNDLKPLRESERFEIQFNALLTRASAKQPDPGIPLHLFQPFFSLLYWRGCSISPDNEYLLSEDTLWDMGTGELVAVLSHGPDDIEKSYFTTTGDSFITQSKKSVFLWEEKMGVFERKPITREEARRLGGEEADVFSQNLPKSRSLMLGRERPSQIDFFDSEGLIVMVHSDGSIQWWSKEENDPVREMHVSSVGVTEIKELSLSFSENGKRMAVYSNCYSKKTTIMKLVDLDSGEIIRRWPRARYQVSFSNEYCMVSEDSAYSLWGSINGPLEVVRIEDGRTVQKFENRWLLTGMPMIFAESSVAVVPVNDGTIRIVDLETGQTETLLSGHSAPVMEVACTNDGTLMASASEDGTVRIWDLDQMKEMVTLQTGESSSSPAAVIRWDLSGKRIAIFQSPREKWNFPPSVAWVWSLESWKELYTIPMHEGINDLSWSPDGTMLATAHQDGYARLWNASDGSPLGSPLHHPEITTSVTFDPTGIHLITGCHENDYDNDYQDDAEEFVPALNLWKAATGEFLQKIMLSGSFLSNCTVPVLVWSPQGDLLATTYKWPTVECLDGTTFETRWYHDVGWGGRPWPVYAEMKNGSRRVYISGSHGNIAGVYDSESGSLLNEPETKMMPMEWGFSYLTGSSDDRFFIATCGGVSTAVFDGQDFSERFHRFEHADGCALLVAPNFVHRGDIPAVQYTPVIRKGRSCTLDSFAPVLYDPKRFQAAAAGVSLKHVDLPTVPVITATNPKGRRVEMRGEQAAVQVGAWHAGGIIGFEVERDGELLPWGSAGTIESDGKGGATLTMMFEISDKPEIHLRIRAVSRQGVLSRPKHMTLTWP